MAATLETFGIVLLIDSNGDFSVGKCGESAVEQYEADIGSIADSGGFRIVNLSVKASLPEQVELEGTVSGEGKAQLVIK